jgi:hypothetical protein
VDGAGKNSRVAQVLIRCTSCGSWYDRIAEPERHTQCATKPAVVRSDCSRPSRRGTAGRKARARAAEPVGARRETPAGRHQSKSGSGRGTNSSAAKREVPLAKERGRSKPVKKPKHASPQKPRDEDHHGYPEVPAREPQPFRRPYEDPLVMRPSRPMSLQVRLGSRRATRLFGAHVCEGCATSGTNFWSCRDTRDGRVILCPPCKDAAMDKAFGHADVFRFTVRG